MRNRISLNKDWLFSKETPESGQGESVNIPHCWNSLDGQDGGNDYYRGTCYYTKKIARKDLPAGDRVYLEFRGTNSSATLTVNGKEMASHDGGYSTWRFRLLAFYFWRQCSGSGILFIRNRWKKILHF